VPAERELKLEHSGRSKYGNLASAWSIGKLYIIIIKCSVKLASRLPDFKPYSQPSRNRRTVELYGRIILSSMVVSRPGGSLLIEGREGTKPATLQHSRFQS
jgi:hypothetical protein